MTPLPRYIPFASFAAVLVLSASARAFTDSNAELKEAMADRSARVVVSGKAAVPARTAWVPTPAKRLDSFKPVLPPEPDAVAGRAPARTVAKADAR